MKTLHETTYQGRQGQHAILIGLTRGPFKSYGKAAFTPETPGQRLVKGKLVDVEPCVEDRVNTLVTATCSALRDRLR